MWTLEVLSWGNTPVCTQSNESFKAISKVNVSVQNNRSFLNYPPAHISPPFSQPYRHHHHHHHHHYHHYHHYHHRHHHYHHHHLHHHKIHHDHCFSVVVGVFLFIYLCLQHFYASMQILAFSL